MTKVKMVWLIAWLFDVDPYRVGQLRFYNQEYAHFPCPARLRGTGTLLISAFAPPIVAMTVESELWNGIPVPNKSRKTWSHSGPED
jgi:hypothetical protein